jgi:hypothetical protein
VSWVTLLLLVIVVGGGYLGWVWGPVWFEQGVVKQMVRDFMNQAIRNPNDAALRSALAYKLRSIASVELVDDAGQPVRRPAVSVDERDITWERAVEGNVPMLRVAFEYERPVTYPLLNRVEVKVIQIDITSDLQRADWGTNR